LKLDPGNLELKGGFIRRAWEQEEKFWLAYTEYMRFMALAEQKIMMMGD
jgi:hypothetical protein